MTLIFLMGCAANRVQQAGAEAGRAGVNYRLAELPKECVTPFQPIARGLASNAVVLIRLYEDKTKGEWSSRLLRCSKLYLNQKAALERL